MAHGYHQKDHIEYGEVWKVYSLESITRNTCTRDGLKCA